MPKITFNLRVHGTEQTLSFLRDARIVVTDNTIKVFADSPDAANMLGVMDGSPVSACNSDPRGTLYEATFGRNGRDRSIRTMKFNRNCPPKLVVVNPWADGKGKYYRGEETILLEEKPRSEDRRGHSRTRIYFAE